MIKEYNPLIWSDLTMDEKKTYQLYEEFQKAYNRLATEKKLRPMIWLPSAYKKTCHIYERDGKYPADDIRESRHWKIFTQIYEKYKHYDGFDATVFITGVFHFRTDLKSISPAILLSHESYKAYIEYIKKIVADAQSGGRDATRKQVFNSIYGTRITINQLLKIPKNEVPSREMLEKFFTVKKEKDSILPKGIVYCIHGMISPYYLALSKTFRKIYPDLDPDVKAEIGFETEDDFEVYAGLVRTCKENYDNLKIMFGDDII